jgi:flavin-dependent dehydrogenase
MQEVDFVVVGCGPAGGTAAREAARSGVETLVLERDPVIGAKRVCAAHDLAARPFRETLRFSDRGRAYDHARGTRRRDRRLRA